LKGALAATTFALLTPDAQQRLGLSLATNVLDLKGRLRCCGCRRKGRVVVSIKWARQQAVRVVDNRDVR